MHALMLFVAILSSMLLSCKTNPGSQASLEARGSADGGLLPSGKLQWECHDLTPAKFVWVKMKSETAGNNYVVNEVQFPNKEDGLVSKQDNDDPICRLQDSLSGAIHLTCEQGLVKVTLHQYYPYNSNVPVQGIKVTRGKPFRVRFEKRVFNTSGRFDMKNSTHEDNLKEGFDSGQQGEMFLDCLIK